jgi:hypothetical protein
MRLRVMLVAVLLGASNLYGVQDPHIDDGTLADRLSGSDREERHEAVEAIRSLGPEKTSRRLRAALIGALERENLARVRRSQAQNRGQFVEPPEDPDFYPAVARAVVALRDPLAIPALSGALGSGVLVAKALAEFGEEAAPAVLMVVSSSDDSRHDEIDGGLLTLRLMVEGADRRPLSTPTLGRMREAAERRLTNGTGLNITTLWWALDLAITLKDPSLRQKVERLATDWNAVEATGIKDVELGQQTQKRATDLLAGVAPLPRP